MSGEIKCRHFIKIKNMKYYHFFFIVILLVVSCQRDKYIQISGYAQGGTYTVKLNLRGDNGILDIGKEELKYKIDSILNEIDTTLSGYNKKSMLSRFNSGEEIVPNKLFKDMYRESRNIWKETGGVIDCAAAALFDIWGFGFTDEMMPDSSKVEYVKSRTGMKFLKPEISGNRLKSVDLLLPGSDSSVLRPKINYNAIAQGYSCDLVANYLFGLGIKDMLVDIGEIYCSGKNPAGKAWTLGIDRPVDGNNTPGADIVQIISSENKPCGIVTSGNYRKYYIRNGKKYSHTIDPRTGYPVSHNLLSATIIAPTALQADALASYCMVIGTEAAEKFISSRDDIEGYLIYSDEKGKLQEWSSTKL